MKSPLQTPTVPLHPESATGMEDLISEHTTKQPSEVEISDLVLITQHENPPFELEGQESSTTKTPPHSTSTIDERTPSSTKDSEAEIARTISPALEVDKQLESRAEFAIDGTTPNIDFPVIRPVVDETLQEIEKEAPLPKEPDTYNLPSQSQLPTPEATLEDKSETMVYELVPCLTYETMNLDIDY